SDTFFADAKKVSDTLHEAGAELADLDRRPLRGGAPRRDLDGLLAAVAVEQEEAADDFLRLDERPVVGQPLAVPDLDPDAGRIALQRLADLQQTLRLQLLAELHHALVEGAAFGLAALGALARRLDDQQHVAHSGTPVARH